MDVGGEGRRVLDNAKARTVWRLGRVAASYACRSLAAIRRSRHLAADDASISPSVAAIGWKRKLERSRRSRGTVRVRPP